MKKIKLIFGLTIVIGLMACSKSSNEVKATTQLNDLLKQELTKQEKEKYNYFYNNAIKNNDVSRSGGGSGGSGTGPGSAPSYLTVNLGMMGTGYTLDDASFIATRLNKINVRGSNGCLSVNAVNIIELPTQAGKYYIEYNKIFSNFSELISVNGNITLINANIQSCACGEGSSTSSNLGVNYTGYVTGSNFVINTIAFTSSSTFYCF